MVHLGDRMTRKISADWSPVFIPGSTEQYSVHQTSAFIHNFNYVFSHFHQAKSCAVQL